MEVLQLHGEKEIWLYTPKKPYELACLTGRLQGAVCILIVDDQKISTDRKNQICMDIVYSECEWVACLGYDGSDWDDRLDWSYLESIDFDSSFKETLLTSWHDDETLVEVLEPFLRYPLARNGALYNKIAIILLGSDHYTPDGIKHTINQLLH
jgi:hypothetical protein